MGAGRRSAKRDEDYGHTGAVSILETADCSVYALDDIEFFIDFATAAQKIDLG